MQQVVRDVRADLTRDQGQDAAVGFLSPGLRPYHRECAGANRATHVELAVPDRQVGTGMIHKAPYLSPRIHIYQNPPQWTVTEKLQGQRLVLLEHTAQQQPGSQGAAQGSAGRRCRLVTSSRFLNQAGGHCGQRADGLVCGGGFHQPISRWHTSSRSHADTRVVRALFFAATAGRS